MHDEFKLVFEPKETEWCFWRRGFDSGKLIFRKREGRGLNREMLSREGTS